MEDDPIEPAPPPQNSVSQFREEGSVKGRKVPVFLEGSIEEGIGMVTCLLIPCENVEADRSRTFAFQNLPVLAISSSLAIRSSIGG